MPPRPPPGPPPQAADSLLRRYLPGWSWLGLSGHYLLTSVIFLSAMSAACVVQSLGSLFKCIGGTAGVELTVKTLLSHLYCT
eukprot:6303208-Pyramimonas_sp.AAC.1